MDLASENAEPQARRDAQQLLAQAAEELARGGRHPLPPLLDAYRQLAPPAHVGANQPLPDLEFLRRAHVFANFPLCGAQHWLLVPRHGRAEVRFLPTHSAGVARVEHADSLSALADLMTLALGVCLEATKFRTLLRGVDLDNDASAWLCAALQVEPEALREALGGGLHTDSNDGQLIARWMEQSSQLTLHRFSGDSKTGTPAGAEAPHIGHRQDEGPVYIVAGATERLHDLLSPYVRRLEHPLRKLSVEVDDDAPYAGLSMLYSEEPLAHDERLQREEQDGFVRHGNALFVSCRTLRSDGADPRTRRALQRLKQSRAQLVICDRSPTTLAACLVTFGEQAKGLALLSEGFHTEPTSFAPTLLEDAASGHLMPIRNLFSDAAEKGRVALCQSVPSLGLALSMTPCSDASLYALATVCLRAQADGHLPVHVPWHVAVSRADQPQTHSSLCLQLLDAWTVSTASPSSRAPSPLWQRQFLR